MEMIEDYLKDQLDTIEDFTKLREAIERIINVFNYYKIKIDEPLPLIIDGKYRLTITPPYLEEDDE